MFEKGDKYIHFTKYGGVNSGEISVISETTVADTVNGFVYIRSSIRNTNGISLELDGSDGKIYKVKNALTKEQCEAIKEKVEKIAFYKKNKRAEFLLKHGKDIDIIA